MSTRPGSPDPDLKQRSGSERTRRFVLAATVIGSAMAFIDGTIVTIALPVIQRELSAAFQDLQWVVNSYTLMLGALILVGGALGDRMGRRRIFVHGLGIFAVASLFCAIAANVHVLIAARVLQGFGAALLVPQSLAIIAATFPRDVRGRAIGAWAAASAIAAALGPPLGGLLIDTLTWRAAFLINLPLSGAALWLTFAHVPESRDETASGPVDWLGAALAVTALGALTYGLTLVSEGADRIMVIAAAIAAGVIGLGAFWRVEKHATNPMLPAGLFRSRPFLVTNIITLLLYGALGGVLFLLPFDLIARRGMAASAVGTVLLPFGLIIGLLSRPAGRLADRHGPKDFLVGGSLVVAVASAALALNIQSLWLGVFAPVVLMAFGMAAVVSPLTTTVMNAVPDERSGVASGINNAASRLAGLFAVAALGAVAGLIFHLAGAPAEARFGELPGADSPARAGLEQAFLTAYAAAMALGALGAALAAAAAYFGLSREDCGSLFLDPRTETGGD